MQNCVQVLLEGNKISSTSVFSNHLKALVKYQELWKIEHGEDLVHLRSNPNVGLLSNSFEREKVALRKKYVNKRYLIILLYFPLLNIDIVNLV